jgi:hypothetical protein
MRLYYTTSTRDFTTQLARYAAASTNFTTQLAYAAASTNFTTQLAYAASADLALVSVGAAEVHVPVLCLRPHTLVA